MITFVNDFHLCIVHKKFIKSNFVLLLQLHLPHHGLYLQQSTSSNDFPAICPTLLVHMHHMRAVILSIPMHGLLSI